MLQWCSQKIGSSPAVAKSSMLPPTNPCTTLCGALSTPPAVAPASRKCCHPDEDPPNVATRDDGDENGWCSTPGPGTLTRGSTAAMRWLTLGSRLGSKRAFGLPSQ